MPRKKAQPNFGDFFHSSCPERIDYVTRPYADWEHDLKFICSYVHDAEFDPADFRCRGNRVLLPVRRDCWELYRHIGELVTVPSELILSGADRVEWRIPGRGSGLSAFPIGENLIIDYLAGLRRRRNQISICVGFGEVELLLEKSSADSDDIIEVRVRDKAVPDITAS